MKKIFLFLLTMVTLTAFALNINSRANEKAMKATNAKSNEIVLFDKTFKEKLFTFKIPQIKGMTNKNVQDLINENIKKNMVSDYEEDPTPNSSIDGNSKIIFKNDKLIVIQYDGLYDWPDEPHPGIINAAMNIDLTTGQIYKLDDLFNTKIDYKSQLKTLIKNNKKKYKFKSNETAYYNGFTYDDFIDNFDSLKFVMHKDYVQLYYDGIYAVGTVAGYKIPYDEIDALINKNGKLWKAFKNIS